MLSKKHVVISLTIILFFLSAVPGFAETKILPIINFRLAGGGFSYSAKDQDKTSTPFNGDTNLDFVPVIRFSDKVSLLPRYVGSYTGISSLNQIEDKEILYQQSIYQLFSLGLLYKFNPSFKFNTEIGGSNEWARESKDEKWKTGIYDNRSRFVTLAIEKRYPDSRIPFLIGGGWKFYTIHYPNYQPSTTVDVLLNNYNQEVFLNGDATFGEESLLKWDVTFTRGHYGDKKILSEWEIPLYSEGARKDDIFEINSKCTFPLVQGKGNLKTYWGLGVGIKNKNSQDSFEDTAANMVVPHFHEYRQIVLIPSFSVRLLPSNFTINIDYELFQREYPHRVEALPKNAGEDFAYGVNATIRFLKVGLYYPLKNGFSLDGSVNFRNSTSRAEYQPEKYNYKSFNYLLGFSYEY